VGLNGLYIIVVGEINVMIAAVGPMFETDYIDKFRMYMEAKDALKLLDELDMENEGVVEKMYLSGRLKGHV
jgi:hypothetical protein